MADVSPLATLEKIRRVIRQVVEQFHPQKVILFGSYAYQQCAEKYLKVVNEKDCFPPPPIPSVPTRGSFAATVDDGGPSLRLPW
jgi:hypothetical protein